MHVVSPGTLSQRLTKSLILVEVILEIVSVGWCARGYRPPGFVFLNTQKIKVVGFRLGRRMQPLSV
jgi:hypothetical protein